jgi:hypothetical protein
VVQEESSRKAGLPGKVQPEARGLDIRSLQAGERVQLTGNVIAEVVANPGDGMWVLVRYQSVPDNPAMEGQEDLVAYYSFVEQA